MEPVCDTPTHRNGTIVCVCTITKLCNGVNELYRHIPTRGNAPFVSGKRITKLCNVLFGLSYSITADCSGLFQFGIDVA